MLRRAGAFLAAPFPAAIFQSIVVAVWPKEGQGVFEHQASMFIAVCTYFYVFGLLIGVPAWLIMRKRNTMGLQAHALAGLVVGILPVGTALGWTIIQGASSAYVVAYNLLLFGLGGMAAGATFWLISRRRRT